MSWLYISSAFHQQKGKLVCKPFSLSIQMLKEAAFVSRTINQSDRRFSISSRRKSCFMSLLALLYHGHACLVHRWHSNNIHNILYRGNGVYLNTLKSGKITEAQTLAISNLLLLFTASERPAGIFRLLMWSVKLRHPITTSPLWLTTNSPLSPKV